ncbi:MAG TPA: hypothetical protein ENH26_01110 [Candidatus Wolfebacteria bacterium]|nr:hypothetical protein [Candidatus Wolfebacteria bacterium]
MITLERWKTFSKRDQLGHIASEILRANSAKNRDAFIQMLERAIDLIDISLNDEKWRGNPLLLLILRNELAKAYMDKSLGLEKIYAAI